MTTHTVTKENLVDIITNGLPSLKKGDVIIHKDYDVATVHIALSRFYTLFTLQPISAGTSLYTKFGRDCSYVVAIGDLLQ